MTQRNRLLILVACLLCSANTLWAELPNRLGIAHIGRASPLENEVAIQWLGSGFLVDRECRVVTARHLFERTDRQNLVVRFLHPESTDRSRTFSARLIHEDEEIDLAVLQFAEKTPRFCRGDAFAPFDLAESIDPVALTGESVRIAGYPMLEGERPREIPIVRRGAIASAELTWDGRPMLLLDLTGVPGFSGAPVILESTGEVVGLVFGPGRTRREYDLEWATPLTGPDLEERLDAR